MSIPHRVLFIFLLLALSAGAALAGESLPSEAYDWTGFYYGVHAGAVASRSEWKDPTGDFGYLGSDFNGEAVSGGGIFGMQAGYNWQIDNAVLGLEGEFSSVRINNVARCFFGTTACLSETDYLGTLAARFGVTAGDLLFYGKAGGAWAHTSQHMDMTVFQNRWSAPDSSSWGWILGAGVEAALDPSLTAKIEYDYVDFGTEDHTFTDQFGASIGASIRQNAHIVKFGLNQKFDGLPFSGEPNDATPMTAGSWTGFYAGAHLGGAMGHDQWTSATGFLDAWGAFPPDRFPGEDDSGGMLAGGQIGVNYQVGNYVLGAEAAASVSDYEGFAKCAFDTGGAAGFNWTCDNRTTAMGNISGRLGRTFGNLLLYGKAGAGWAVHSGTMEIRGVDKKYESSKDVHWGLLFGAGAEYAFSPNLSAFLEYNRTNYGNSSTTYTIDDATAVIGIHVDHAESTVGFKQDMDVVKAGLNYRFGASGSDMQAYGADESLLDPSGWTLEVGERLVGGGARTQLDQYAPSYLPNRLNSRIVFDDKDGQGVETFFRLDHESGLFAKGNIGIGRFLGGRMNDEDFDILRFGGYSNTVSDQEHGRQINAAADVGYNFIDEGPDRFGAFVGYRSFYTHSHAFGLTQIGSADTSVVAEAPENLTTLSKSENWRGVAIGLNSTARLSDRLRLDVDAAWLPYADYAGIDNHWLRADIDPLDLSGHGSGTQFEAALSYDMTDRFSLGIGGRYSSFATTSADTEFPVVDPVSGVVFGVTQPLKSSLQSYSGFLQASYRFGDLNARVAADEAATVNWTGIYAGVALGSAFGQTDYDDPFPGALPHT
ncbi:MAG: outer membrane beta-barrel protein, partial [Methyloceanibacter sp.]